MKEFVRHVPPLVLLVVLAAASATGQDVPPALKSPLIRAQDLQQSEKAVEKDLIQVRLKKGMVKTVHNPRFREVADKKFWWLVAATYASSVFDIESLQHCRRVDPTCREFNPLLGQRRPQQYAVKFAINTAFLWTIYKYRRIGILQQEVREPDALPPWWVVGHAWTGVNAATGMRNLLHDRPSSRCPSGTTCAR